MAMSDAHTVTIDLVFRAVGIMVPVVATYLVVFIGGVGTLWEVSTKRFVKISWLWVSITLAIGLLSLGIFAAALHYSFLAVGNGSTMETNLFQARLCLARGYTLFVVSLISGAYTCLRAVRPHRSG